MCLISIYGTVYNNFITVDKTILSLYRILPNFEDHYELVIVDNFSTDGTWEKLLKIKAYFKNLKLIRCYSTRGKGRHIALQHTSGDYVMYVDFDCVFDPLLGVIIDKLSKVIVKGEIWDFGPPLRIGFARRETATEVNWKDLNYGEDWDFLYRAADKGIKIKYVSVGDLVRNLRSSLLRHGENRYINKKMSYYLRQFRNRWDMVTSYRLNPVHALNIPHSSDLEFMTTLILSSLSSFGKMYAYPIKYNVYANTTYYLPRDLGLPEDRLLIIWEDINLTWNAVKKSFYKILRKEKKFRYIINRLNQLIVVKNYKLYKKSLI